MFLLICERDRPFPTVFLGSRGLLQRGGRRCITRTFWSFPMSLKAQNTAQAGCDSLMSQLNDVLTTLDVARSVILAVVFLRVGCGEEPITSPRSVKAQSLIKRTVGLAD